MIIFVDLRYIRAGFIIYYYLLSQTCSVPSLYIYIIQVTLTPSGSPKLGLPEHRLAGWKLRVAIAVPCNLYSSCADLGTELEEPKIEI